LTTVEVVERHAFRPGYAIASFFEVALPVYRVSLHASTLERKRVSALDEFVMRSLLVGITNSAEISAFLGLDDAIVRATLSGLIRDGDVALAGVPADGGQALRLTIKGARSVELAEAVVPEEKTFQVHFDALLRRPAWYRDELTRYREMKEQGRIEVHSNPPRRPDIRDFPPEEVSRIVRQIGGHRADRVNILAVQRVEQCTRFFRQAVALVYRSLETNDLRVELAIDGRITKEYDIAFARAGGRALLGLDSAPADQAEPTATVSAAGQPIRQTPTPSPEVELEFAQKQAELREATERLPSAADDQEKAHLKQRVEELQERILQLEAERKKRGVRQVYVHEHPRLLEKAFSSAKTRLLLIAPWIRAKVVDTAFLARLRTALERGVQVHIGYGISEVDREMNAADRKAEEALLQLSRKHKHFVLKRLGNTHAKVLVCDRSFIVTGSFNWLSFLGDPGRTYRDEQSTLVEIPEHIDDVYKEELKAFAEDPGA
jgi:hypothetical protein